MPEVRLDNGALRAPCPFCRRTNHHGWVTCSQDDDERAELSYGAMITCKDCHICVSADEDSEDAAKYMAETAWNNCAAVPAGWKLVPDANHMTDEQAEAIAGVAGVCGGIAFDIYRAAIAAAPDIKEGAQ